MTIAIEPVVKHIVYDARRARTVLDEIGSPNLQILFDPVNLLNMEMWTAARKCSPRPSSFWARTLP